MIESINTNVTIQALLRQRPHHIIVESNVTLPAIQLDQNEIQRVLLNLLKNAIDYTPIDSTITISTYWQGDYIRVNIRDQGVGVHPKVEAFLFKLYATPIAKQFRQVGMGLGLYLSRQIIEAHQGRIGYEKQADGSLFYFDIPVASWK